MSDLQVHWIYLNELACPIVYGSKCSLQGVCWHTGIEETFERCEADIELLGSLP
tara:strand:+ start:185 stop:346 length:162 start_codon:yes stop_codon:yes gene_type:complete